MGLSNSQPYSILQPGVCTSGTRPVNPYVGQAIFETDTNKVLIWYTVGTVLGWYPPWNSGWGYVGSKTGDATQPQNTTSAQTDLAGASATITVYQNRRYLVTTKLLITSSVVSDYVRSDFLVGAVLCGFNYGHNIPVAGYQSLLCINDSFTWSSANGAQTAKLQYGRYFGSGTISGRHDIMAPWWQVTDVGPG